MKNTLPKGTKCKVIKTETITLDGDSIVLHEDIVGDTVEIIQHEFYDIYLVKNLTKKFECYVPSTILEELK